MFKKMFRFWLLTIFFSITLKFRLTKASMMKPQVVFGHLVWHFAYNRITLQSQSKKVKQCSYFYLVANPAHLLFFSDLLYFSENIYYFKLFVKVLYIFVFRVKHIFTFLSLYYLFLSTFNQYRVVMIKKCILYLTKLLLLEFFFSQ